MSELFPTEEEQNAVNFMKTIIMEKAVQQIGASPMSEKDKDDFFVRFVAQLDTVKTMQACMDILNGIEAIERAKEMDNITDE